ncbi:membrane protein [Skermanella stibiiresistens SB22]|uniref:Membrane protein n=1 Tax=Skermanella stibiiresistens SB22 TaxID=1385369 RepID=W9H7G2_9PROT|nr:CDP-alcohol phosphatidyltransferase family protein [Skermanella stibiiresistens]EWY40612.1 membrane protein [Skermanella stibiiresistens SB22]
MTYGPADGHPANSPLGEHAPHRQAPPGLAVSVAAHTLAGGLATGSIAVALGQGAGLTLVYPATALGCYAIFAILLALHVGGHAPHDRFGAANQVTLFRGVIASLIGGTIPVLDQLTAEALWVASLAALLALALDGIDGWLARKTRMASLYGKLLDMNFDTVLMGILAVIAWQGGKVGVWVLAIGLARPIFVAVGWIWPILRAELPFSQRRRVICVVQIAVLLVCPIPVVEPPLSSLAAAAALGLLLFSFAVDTLWLVRSGAERDPGANQSRTDIRRVP